MISFEAFRQTDGTPIYLQIIRYIQQGLAAGTIQDGDELPSRRVVSALLAVNPNTVQKAFKQLEDEGLVTSRAGAKSCIQVTLKTSSLLFAFCSRRSVSNSTCTRNAERAESLA